MNALLRVSVLAAVLTSSLVNSQAVCDGTVIAPGAFDASRDYFSSESDRIGALTYAKNFDVTYNKYYKSVNVRAPSGTTQFTLTLCNAQNSTATTFVPVSNVGFRATDLTDASFVEKLGKRPTISYMEATRDNITSSCLQAQFTSGSTLTFPTTGSLTGNTAPSVIFGSSFPTLQSSAQFLSVYDAITSESSPLAQAEWIKFFSLFYNAESTATTLFNSMVTSYTCQSSLAKTSITPTPKVAWTTLRDGQIVSLTTPYIAQLIRDAGGEPVTIATHDDFKNVDILVDGSSVAVNKSYDMNAFRTRYGFPDNSYPFLKDGLSSKVFRTDGMENDRGVDDFGRSWVVAPELLIADMINAYNEEFLEAYPSTWFKSLAKAGAGDTHVPKCPNTTYTFGPTMNLCPSSSSTSPTTGSSGGTGVTGGNNTNTPGAVVGIVIGVLFVISLVICVVFRKDVGVIARGLWGRGGREGRGGAEILDWRVDGGKELGGAGGDIGLRPFQRL
ncbi:hypothetical protein HDV00_011420 [Rhizophlyctis rosea]|nr:hypothetical protein HDV00_011420 [Rhizophlyctis rosea]